VAPIVSESAFAGVSRAGSMWLGRGPGSHENLPRTDSE